MAYINVKLCYDQKFIGIDTEGWAKFTDNKDSGSIFQLEGSDENIKNLREHSTNDYRFEVTVKSPQYGNRWWDRSRNEYIGIYSGSKRTYSVHLVNGAGILESQSGNFYSYVQWTGKSNTMEVGKLISDLKSIENPGAHLGELILGGTVAFVTVGTAQAWFNIAKALFGPSLCESDSKDGESGLLILLS